MLLCNSIKEKEILNKIHDTRLGIKGIKGNPNKMATLDRVYTYSIYYEILYLVYGNFPFYFF